MKRLRFFFTSPTFFSEPASKEKREFYIPRQNREKALYGSEFEIRLRKEFTQRTISKECADWIRSKAQFKSNCTDETMSGFLVVNNAHPIVRQIAGDAITAPEGENLKEAVEQIQQREAREAGKANRPAESKDEEGKAAQQADGVKAEDKEIGGPPTCLLNIVQSRI